MRFPLALLAISALLPAEDLALQSGGGITVSEVPGFIRVSAAVQPPTIHLVRVGAISQIIVPRPDRPGDATILIVPGASETLRILIPVRTQDSAEVLKAIAQASVAPAVPSR